MFIYLNGTSSSGKTSIDTLLYSLDVEDLEAIMGKRPYRFPIDWDSLFSGYFSCVASLINTGNSVIADCPVFDDKLASLFGTQLSPIDKAVIVKVSCPLDIVEEREKKRKDRAVGIAKRQFPKIHKFIAHDFEVDSDQLTPEEAAANIYDFLTRSKLSD